MVDNCSCFINSCCFFRPFNSIGCIAYPVHKALVQCLAGGEDSAVGKLLKFLPVDFCTPLLNHIEKLVVKVFNNLCQYFSLIVT